MTTFGRLGSRVLVFGLGLSGCTAMSGPEPDGVRLEAESGGSSGSSPGASGDSGEVSVTPHKAAPACQEAACCPAGLPILEGDDTDNELEGGSASQCLVGLGGSDVLEAGSAGDYLLGGDGADDLRGDSASDVAAGGDGPDTLDMGSGNDEAYGQQGDDVLDLGSGDDYAEGGEGDDDILGGSGSDTIIPGPGLDTVSAASGNDTVVVYDLCEVEAGEAFDGGSGIDTLVTPVDVATLQGLGVSVSSFETILVQADPGSSQCGSCGCELVQGVIECCSGNGTCDEPDGSGDMVCNCDPGHGGSQCEIGPAACLEETTVPAFTLTWVDLPDPESAATLPSTTLTLRADNLSSVALDVSLKVHGLIDGVEALIEPQPLAVPALGQATVAVDLADFGVSLQDLQYSAQLSVKGWATSNGVPVEEAYAPHAFFHTTSAGTVATVYGESAYRSQFNAGDYDDKMSAFRAAAAARGLQVGAVAFLGTGLPLTDDDDGPLEVFVP